MMSVKTDGYVIITEIEDISDKHFMLTVGVSQWSEREMSCEVRDCNFDWEEWLGMEIAKR